ncbi:unnamed protein product [Closterium sp. Yama58-4]|nr:unnamed protein product [Closterium sp. Yama58-4]
MRFSRPFLDAHRDYKEPACDVPAMCTTLPVALVPVADAFENSPPREPTFDSPQELATCQIQRFIQEDRAVQGPPPAAHPGRVGDGSAVASPCLVCGEDEDENTVLCDLCFAGYHVRCLTSRGEEVHVDKDGEWVCDLCEVEEKRKATVVVVWAEECAENRRTAAQRPADNRLDGERVNDAQSADVDVRTPLNDERRLIEDGDDDVVLLEADVALVQPGVSGGDDADDVVLVPRGDKETRDGARRGGEKRGSGGSGGNGAKTNGRGKGNNEEPWLQNFEKRGSGGSGGNDGDDSVAEHKGHWLLQRTWLVPVGYTRVGPMFQASVPEWTGPPCVFNGAGASGDEEARECNRRYDDDDGARPPFGHEAKWTDVEHRAEIDSWSRDVVHRAEIDSWSRGERGM